MRYSLELIGKWNRTTKKNLIKVGCRVLGHWGLNRFMNLMDQEHHHTKHKKNQKQQTDINERVETQDRS
jgi:hypothetical protein